MVGPSAPSEQRWPIFGRRGTSFGPAVLAVALLLIATTAEAEQTTTWSLTETLIFEWHGETDSFRSTAPEGAHDRDNYLALKNRANLGLRRGPLDFTFRFDQSSFWDTCPSMPEEDANIADLRGCRSPRAGTQENDFRIERATARLHLGRHRLYFGDFPLQVGRGIVLSLRKVSEFGIDDALRGARAQLRLHDDVRLDLFGGVINISNLDDVTDTPQEDPRDRVVGGSIEGRILDVATISAHGVMLLPSSADNSLQEDLNGGEWTALVGGTVALPGLFDMLSLFLEADGLLRNPADPSLDVDEGFAVYATVDLQVGRFTLMGEFKWYENFEVVGTVHQQLDEIPAAWGDRLPRPLAQAPTIEREDQPVPNNRDVLGGRLRLDVRLPSGFLIFANAAYVDARASDAFNTLHAYLGLEYRLGDGRYSGTLSGGYRREAGDEDCGEDSCPAEWAHPAIEIFHAETNASIRLVGRHSVHLAFVHETWNKPLGSGGNNFFHRGTLTVGYDYGSLLSVSVAYEYDTQFQNNVYIVDDTTIDDPGRYEVPTSVRQHFAFAEVRVTPVRWLDLRLRGGTQRGGLRCLSGVCRMFPNFTGVRFESVLRF